MSFCSWPLNAFDTVSVEDIWETLSRGPDAPLRPFRLSYKNEKKNTKATKKKHKTHTHNDSSQGREKTRTSNSDTGRAMRRSVTSLPIIVKTNKGMHIHTRE